MFAGKPASTIGTVRRNRGGSGTTMESGPGKVAATPRKLYLKPS